MLASRLVRDLGSVVLIRSGSMLNRWKDFPKGSWITPELVGDQFLRGLTLSLQHLPKEPFCSLLVPPFRHQNVEKIAVLIDSTPEIELLSLNLHEDFVDIPSIAQRTLPSSEESGISRPKLQAPVSNCFIGDADTTLGQQIFDIPEAEREPMVKPDCMADNLGRESVALAVGCHAPIVVNSADCPST